MVNGSLWGTRPTEFTVSLGMHKMMSRRGCKGVDGREAPYPEKIDLNRCGKRISESAALLPPGFILTSVHFISKRNLLLIVRRQEPDLCV
jgi:hypothetical protein